MAPYRSFSTYFAGPVPHPLTPTSLSMQLFPQLPLGTSPLHDQQDAHSRVDIRLQGRGLPPVQVHCLRAPTCNFIPLPPTKEPGTHAPNSLSKGISQIHSGSRSLLITQTSLKTQNLFPKHGPVHLSPSERWTMGSLRPPMPFSSLSPVVFSSPKIGGTERTPGPRRPSTSEPWQGNGPQQ